MNRSDTGNSSTYRDYLTSEIWPVRVQILSVIEVLGFAAIALLDYLSVGRGLWGLTPAALSVILLARLPGLAVAIGLVAFSFRTPRGYRHIAGVAIVGNLLYTLCNDWAEYHLGHGLSVVHAVVIATHVMILPAFLPLLRREAAAMYGSMLVGHTALAWIYGSPFSLAEHVTANLALAASGLFSYSVSELLYRNQRTQFELRRNAEDSLHSLEATQQNTVLIADSLAEAATELAAVTGNLLDNASRVSSESKEIAAGIEELSSSARALAERTHSSMDQVDDVGGRAARVDDLVRVSAERLAEITSAVLQSGTSVDELGKRTRDIGEVIGVIHEIAAQTNLLALNASIEASRAGEQGRGFGVVAQEVRKLAEDTHSRATDINESVGDVQSGLDQTTHTVNTIQTSVDNFSEAFSESREALEAIRQGMLLVTQVFSHTLDSTNEQAATAERVSDGALSVTRLAQENAQASEQVSATAATLNDLAERLRRTVRGNQ